MNDSCIVPPPITDPKEQGEREPDLGGLELTELRASDSSDVRIAEMRLISERLILGQQGGLWLFLYLILPLMIGLAIGSIITLIILGEWQEPDQQADPSDQGVVVS